MLTFGQIKCSRLNEVAAATSDSENFRSLLNEAIEALLNRGDWRGTLQPIYVCVRNGCVTWPRYVHAVRKLNHCNREIQVNNIWYQFVERDFYSNWLGMDYWNVVRPLNGNEQFRQMNSTGYFSTYNDVPSPSYINAYPSALQDIGKKVTIFGFDSNGLPLRHQDSDGNWCEGSVITLAAPYGQTLDVIRSGSIRVLKDETQGEVRLYAQDYNTATLTDLAVYAPTETTPNYARYRLHGGRHCWNANDADTGDRCYGVLALVKVEFIPVKHDSDIVLIDNIQALKFAVQSIKYSEAGDVGNAELFMGKAVRELNLELRNEMSDSSIPVVFKAFGSATPRRAGIGRIN